MKNIDELTLKIICDILTFPYDYNTAERDVFKEVVNQISGALRLHDAVKGEEKRKENAQQ